MKCALISLLSFLSLSCIAQKDIITTNGPIKAEKIWDNAPHSAFTDLLRFKNKWYCTFREGPGHKSGPVGQARLLKSTDGKTWQSIDSFKLEGMDVRDPKLSVTPDNRIMVLMDVETYKDGKVETRSPWVSYSDKNGNNFSRPEKSIVDKSISVNSDWVWRVTWNKGMGYAVVYQPDALYLLKTKDGKFFEKVCKLDVDGSPNESTIRFDKNDKMYIIIRREKEDQLAVLAKSEFPYVQWKFNKMNYRAGGPNFIIFNDTTLCIGSRLYEYENEKLKPSTVIFLSDLDGKIYKVIKLPSGGDTSYPGMVIYKDELWFSYYSSHEGKTAIYLAKVPLNQLTK
jgi:hypothetical protein